MNNDYFLIITAQKYSSDINLKKHIRIKKQVLYIALIGFVIILFYILSFFFPNTYFRRPPSSLVYTLFQLIGLSLLGVLSLLLAYCKLQELKMLASVSDISITSKGIYLPFPYDKITKERFVQFKDIRKITVIYTFSRRYIIIWLHLSKKFKPWNPIASPTRIDLLIGCKEGHRIISTIKSIMGDLIEIEYWK